VKCQVLALHTHWGDALMQLINQKHPVAYSFLENPKDKDELRIVQCELKKFASTLWKRIKAFLAGKNDPLWGSDVAVVTFREPKVRRNRIARSQRFLEMLQTVDGMFVQRFSALPEEVWTWNKFDLFVLNSISHLISDEFFDGELKENLNFSEKTAYEGLKDFRKLAKFRLHTCSLSQDGPVWPDQSPEGWYSYLFHITNLCYGWKEGPRKLQCLSYLTQTRCAGVPPPIVVLKAKLKCLRTFSTPPEPLEPGFSQVIAAAVDGVIQKIPDHAFTGLHTKAGVNATSSACYEYKRSEHGTLQGLKDIIQGYEAGVEVPTMDLTTGKEGPWLKPGDASLGTYIFWACLRVCISTDPDELSTVILAVAEEPGKARVVTKGKTALKVVLDVVNHICSWPLAKGLDSSATGMKASHHAWNVFKTFYKGENKSEFFRFNTKDFPKEKEVGEDTYLDFEYKDIFSSSTDYSTATDYFHHEVARIIANKWMLKVGIPPVLRGLVNRICYERRKVLFSGTGPLSVLGEICTLEGHEDKRELILLRGVLMGDPLTKVILHLLNASVRSLVESSATEAFFRNYIRNPSVITESVRAFLTRH